LPPQTDAYSPSVTLTTGAGGRRRRRSLTMPDVVDAAAVAVRNRAAIYCRISEDKRKDEDGVERQEEICRGVCDRMMLELTDDHVFIDNNRSAWKRDRKRPNWDAMLEAAKRGEIDVIVCYHPDRLMRQPRDLEDLLDIAQDHNIRLVGNVNGRDLSNPDDIFMLRIEVAHACRSSDDTSRRMKDKLRTNAEKGKAHGGPRPYGFQAGDRNRLVPEEADVIRNICQRLLCGESIRSIAEGLNQMKVPTATGKQWAPGTIRKMIDSPRIAGFRMYHDQVIKGEWPAIITPGEWEELQLLGEHRAARWEQSMNKAHSYVLRGTVRCSLCGHAMVGDMTGKVPGYKCKGGGTHRRPDAGCNGLRITAVPLEDAVEDFVRRYLERTNLTARRASATIDPVIGEKISSLEAKLLELAEMFAGEEMSRLEYETARRRVRDDLGVLRAQTVVRPIAALEGVTAESFGKLPVERKNAAYRALLDSVTILPATPPVNRWNPERIKIRVAADLEV
jgi:site-specific DNA recombinase